MYNYYIQVPGRSAFLGMGYPSYSHYNGMQENSQGLSIVSTKVGSNLDKNRVNRERKRGAVAYLGLLPPGAEHILPPPLYQSQPI